MLSDLEDKLGRAAGDGEAVENRRQTLIELHVDDGTDDGDDAALGSLGRRGLRRGLSRRRSGHRRRVHALGRLGRLMATGRR